MIIAKKTVRLVTPPEPEFVGTRLGIRIREAGQKFGIYRVTFANGCDSMSLDWGDGCAEAITFTTQITHTYAAPDEYEVKMSDDISELGVCALSEDIAYGSEYPKCIEYVTSNAQHMMRTAAACFANSANLKTVDLGESAITTHAVNAFAFCRSLRSYRLPHGLQSIGNYSFRECERIMSVDLPDGVTHIQPSTFLDCRALSGEIWLPFIQTVKGTATTVPFAGCCGGITVFHFAKANEASIRTSAGFQADPTLGTGTGICVFDL